MGDMHRLTRTLFDTQCDTAGHECGVQPQCNIVFARDVSETVGRLLGCKGEKFGQGDGGVAGVEIAPTWLVTPVDDGNSACFDIFDLRYVPASPRRFCQW